MKRFDWHLVTLNTLYPETELLLYVIHLLVISKKISLHKIQNVSLRQGFCACCNYNVKQVILMPTYLVIVWLHIEFNLCFVTIFFFTYF